MVRKSFHSDAYAAMIDALIAARKSADLTQVELAERIGKPQSWVAKYEGRARRLDMLELYVIARALKRDPADLFADLARDLPKRVSI